MVLATSAACGGGGRSEPGASDTGGQHIGDAFVRDSLPTWSPAQQWKVNPEASIILDAGDGSTGYDIVGGLRFETGAMVVASGGDHSLTYFDSTGRVSSRLGGAGDGPGEFRRIEWVQRWHGDSIVVFDFQHKRLSFFDNAGRLGRDMAPAPTNGAYVQNHGVFRDGTALGRMFVPEPNPTGGAFRLSWRWLRLSADQTLSNDSMGWAPGRDEYRVALGDGRTMQFVPYFARQTYYLVIGNSFHVASSDEYVVRVYSNDGVFVKAYGRPHAVVPVSRAQMMLRRAQIASSGNERRVRIFDSMEIPLTPALGGRSQRWTLRADPDGHVWVREYNPIGDSTTRMSVFDSTGTWLGIVSIGDGVDVMDVGRDYILGKWSDELGLEYVGLFPLIK